TSPDKPRGRGLKPSPNIVKSWAIEHSIAVLDPIKLDDDFLKIFNTYSCVVSVVASYSKIIPEKVLNAVNRKTLNIHPSLLPKYRGATPIQTAILEDAKDTGVSIMRLDREMDHGPIIAVKPMHFDEWPIYEIVEKRLGIIGGELLAAVLPEWINGTIVEKEQDHTVATYTKKFSKEDGLIDFADLDSEVSSEHAYDVFRKIQAYHASPGTYFFVEKNGLKVRVKITSATWKNGRLMIERVIPEGKKEISYTDFIKNINNTISKVKK
ncbi:MAG: hypothetical protein KGJ35_03685, partial [Patescibacteria group bacterium]|nr:hypothetical protein [Patescibacteria group bacterium]